MIIACPQCGRAPLENIWPGDFGNVYECGNCGKIVTENLDEKEITWDDGSSLPMKRQSDSLTT